MTEMQSNDRPNARFFVGKRLDELLI